MYNKCDLWNKNDSVTDKKITEDNILLYNFNYYTEIILYLCVCVCALQLTLKVQC